MASRKSKWSRKEDHILANKVFQYMQSGKTQLEAFKDVGEELGRTSAACGYRWNAKLRNMYREKLNQFKQKGEQQTSTKKNGNPKSPLQTALKYLQYLDEHGVDSLEEIQDLIRLKKENELLKKKLYYFEQAYSHAFSLETEE